MGVAFFMTLYAGFTHAFETDHLLAVSNLVTVRNKTRQAVQDGLFWGLGHTTTLFIIGILILVLRYHVQAHFFQYLEAGVGLMLVILGFFRLWRWNKNRLTLQADGNAAHTHHFTHFPAFGIGMIHGLAGSGSLLLIVMSQMQSVAEGLWQLLLFGAGSVTGMMLAAGVFSIPFSQRILKGKWLQLLLVWISALLCIFFGTWIMGKNLMA